MATPAQIASRKALFQDPLFTFEDRENSFAVSDSFNGRKSPDIVYLTPDGYYGVAQAKWDNDVRQMKYNINGRWMFEAALKREHREKYINRTNDTSKPVSKQISTSVREEVDLRMLRFIHDIPLDPGYIDTSYGKLATEVRGSKYHTRNSLQQFVTDNYVKVEVLPFNRGIRIEVV